MVGVAQTTFSAGKNKTSGPKGYRLGQVWTLENYSQSGHLSPRDLYSILHSTWGSLNHMKSTEKWIRQYYNFGFLKNPFKTAKFVERFCKKWQNNPSGKSHILLNNNNTWTFGNWVDLKIAKIWCLDSISSGFSYQYSVQKHKLSAYSSVPPNKRVWTFIWHTRVHFYSPRLFSY